MPTALITGASSGIGLALAGQFARHGYSLILTARSSSQLQERARVLEATYHVQVRTIVLDLSEPGAALALHREAGSVPVDALVNNAGFGALGHFLEIDAEQQIRMLELNVVALTHITRLFAPAMAARKQGRILNVASTAAFQPGPLMAVYYASKAYVLSFSEAIRNELRDQGVTVTTLCPGPTRTEFQERAGMHKTRLFTSGNVMSADEVARIGYAGLVAGKSVVIPGTLNRLMAFSTRFAPRRLTASLARKVQETT